MPISFSTPDIEISRKLCTVLPSMETSFVMREMTSPFGVSSTYLTGKKRILSLMRMRMAQVKCRETTLFMINIVARLHAPEIRYSPPKIRHFRPNAPISIGV